MKTQKETSRNLPDFIIIGSQGSGTTWLYRNIQNHPEIRLSPIKEVHYFDAEETPSAKRRERYWFHTRRLIERTIGQTLRGNFGEVWNLLQLIPHFLFGKRDNAWYVRLFRPGIGQIAGEATPAYAVLGIRKIHEVHRINPDVKLIYIMRDPIERSWARVIKRLARQKKTVADSTLEEIYQILDLPGLIKRSDHLKVLENWQSVFPAMQFFITFYENIEREPEQLILDIYAFLGVTVSEDYISPHLRRKVNYSGKPKPPIPSEFERHLANRHLQQLKELAKRFDGPPSDWLQRAEAILKRS